ncbi:coniferin beta-glucosidase [Cryptomeria japonica]|uniref:coniferin beta-glucosidase n=1 Tax=Cryptomeria japonica TaxID=3369 RepID=UPI0027DA814C|nr:coniferin beta-glucosidase [Cryptomeria japonica]
MRMAAALQKLFFCIFFALFWRAKALERSDFPSNFIFGTASAAYQYEGAWNEDGKGPSVWDDFSHSPGRIVDGSNGDVADDQYYRYAEDMELVDSLGLKAYRFSISWSRIFPDGRGKINMAGIEYYNNLINALLKKGIEPFVTLFHFDLPKALEDSYGGWLSPHIVKDFEAYADVCFEAFGDRVRYWATLNEPNLFVPLGYTIGRFPPARCSFPFGTCLHGNSLSEPYLAGHHILLSHAAAVNIYNNKYQKTQRESIVFVVSSSWYEALEDTPDDQAAVDRMLAFNIRWFLDPIVFGDYPGEMREKLGSRLPKFSPEESGKLAGSFDFMGINHYITVYATSNPHLSPHLLPQRYPDSMVYLTGERNGIPIGEQTAMEGSYVVPRGIQNFVQYLTEIYNRPPIIITENAWQNQRMHPPICQKL